jgi:hypothetical protein
VCATAGGSRTTPSCAANALLSNPTVGMPVKPSNDGREGPPMTKQPDVADLLRYGSWFLHETTPEEIEQRREKLETIYNRKLEVREVEHHSLVATRVKWKVASE